MKRGMGQRRDPMQVTIVQYTGISKCPSVQGAGHPPGPRGQADARQRQRSQEDPHLPPRHGQADMT